MISWFRNIQQNSALHNYVVLLVKNYMTSDTYDNKPFLTSLTKMEWTRTTLKTSLHHVI